MQNEKNQNRVYVIGFALIVLVVLWFLLKPLISNWQNSRKDAVQQKANQEILKAPSALSDDVYKIIQDKTKITIIDISDPADFGRGHIISSVNAVTEKLDKNFFSTLGADRMTEILIVNQGGDLVNLATLVNRLISQGFVNVKYLRGGIPDWRQKGFPLVSSGGADTDSAKVKKITVDQAKNEMATEPDLVQFLDVRDKDSFSKSHIAGAINIPLTELETRYGEISAVKNVIIYGASTQDGFQAAVKLFDLNYFNVYQMDGAFDDWKAAGGKTESGN